MSETQRNLKGDVVINELIEPYPTKDQKCQNNGQLTAQTQTYYNCLEHTDPTAKPFRVNKETYDMLVTSYSDQFQCNMKDVTNDVCVCPKGYGDFVCATDDFQKCFVQITTPDLAKGCADKEDTPYYLYSIPGFSPCYFFDFNASYNFGYKLRCKYLNETGEMAPVTYGETTGYQYRDVVSVPKYNEFKYLAQNPETMYSVMEVPKITLQFEFFDMKYLSQTIIFNATVADAGVFANNTEGNLSVDFSLLTASDAQNGTKYVVGGRTYFEASVYGNVTQSFTTKGFFDQANYVEPVNSSIGNKPAIVWLIVISSILAFVVIVTLLYCFCCKKKSNVDEEYERKAMKIMKDE